MGRLEWRDIEMIGGVLENVIYRDIVSGIMEGNNGRERKMDMMN